MVLCLLVAAIMLIPSVVIARQYRNADINRDGRVNILDASIMMDYWGKRYPRADLNKNGIVDIYDASILIQKWTG
jgi:hypothetical protein